MKSRTTLFLRELKKAVKPRGKKVEIASLCGATPQMVSAWLSGVRRPSQPSTLTILAWLPTEARERILKP